ncbi:MAG: sodium ion-translocating decarboxylase subunit beta, partial [Planctomycetota bacterium]
MDALQELLDESGFANLTWQNLVMFAVGGLLIYLAVRKRYEPLLLIPIGFGAILANLPLAAMSAKSGAESAGGGLLQLVYDSGIETKFLPPVIFLGVGALTDFRPLLSRPITFLLGAAAQLGIFAAAMGAFYVFDFTKAEAASIGIIGGADGPTTIFVASQLAPEILGAVAVAAYSYMSLVPIIQPPIMRLLTTKKERAIDMPQAKRVSKTAVILFPIVTGVLAALAVPACAPLIGMLMFGNLLRESGVTDRLFKTAGGSLINIVTIFLGIVVGATMTGETFLQAKTLGILVLGAVAFGFSTFGGVIFAKVLNLFLAGSKKINPCIGAAGVPAVPM